MVQWSTVVATAAVTTLVGEKVREARAQAKAESEQSEDAEGTTAVAGEPMVEQEQLSELEELVQIQRTNNAPPEAVDSFVGETVTVADGATATVEVTPAQGFDLRVDRVYWDRRDNFSYNHVVGAIDVSNAHQADFTRPRKVTQGGKVFGEATNNSGATEEIDYELEGWAIPTHMVGGDH